MRYPLIAFCALLLSSCQTNQTVLVQTVTTQVAGNNSSQSHKIKVVRDPVLQPTPSSQSMISNPTKPIKAGVNPNPRDLDAVSRYCEEKASKVVYLKFGCSSEDQKKTCEASKTVEATHLLEFKHCLATFGWKEY